MYPVAIDGWTGEAYDGISVQKMIDLGAIIAVQYYGHDLTYGEGYPATIVVPGYGGSTWCKTLKSIEFKQEPAFDPMPSYATNGFGWTVNSAWFDNDGIEAKVGEPITLEGFTWTWSGLHGNTDTISFSADYGVTWQTFEVPDEFDPDQWAHWNLTWTPDAPGSYILHVKATAEDGTEQMGNASIIVKVTE